MSTPEPTQVHIPYEITTIRETQTFGAGNQLEDVLEIGFKGPSGGVYTVRVPLAQADAAHIDTAIQERLGQIMAIHDLGPQPHPQNLQLP